MKMSCDPILEMRLSQADLKAMFERNKQPANMNPALHGFAPGAKFTPDREIVSIINPSYSKFRNVKVEYYGLKFDSKHELECWQNLKLRERAGEISNLERQVRFDLEVNGKRIGKITVDFTWYENGSKDYVVADAKSEITRKETAYRLRKRIFEALYHPLVIREL